MMLSLKFMNTLLAVLHTLQYRSRHFLVGPQRMKSRQNYCSRLLPIPRCYDFKYLANFGKRVRSIRCLHVSSTFQALVKNHDTSAAFTIIYVPTHLSRTASTKCTSSCRGYSGFTNQFSSVTTSVKKLPFCG